jgi:hypothetical protein
LGQQQAILFAIFRHKADACSHRFRRAADDHLLIANKNLPAVFRVRAKDGAQRFRAPRADETGDAENFTASHLEADRAHTFARAQVAHPQGHFAHETFARALPLGKIVADHFADQLGGRHVAGVVGRDGPAIAHHRDAIGDAADFIHPVADVNNPHTLALQPADVVKQLLDLGVGQRRRRFIQDEQLAILRQRAGNLDQLLLTHAQISCGHGGINGAEAHAREGLARGFVQVGEANKSASARQAIEKNIFRDAHRPDDVEFLQHHDDASVFGLPFGGRVVRMVFQPDVSAIAFGQPRENAHKGGLARAIATHQRMNFSRP